MNRLFSSPRCPFSKRAKMALCYVEMPFELYEINLKEKPEEFLNLSPTGTVPLLITDENKIISESLDIVAYALQKELSNQLKSIDRELIPLMRELKEGADVFNALTHPLKFIEQHQEESEIAIAFYPFVKRLIVNHLKIIEQQTPSLINWCQTLEKEERYRFALSRYKVNQRLLIHEHQPKLQTRIEKKLKELPIETFELVNESQNHGFSKGIESHFKLFITSQELSQWPRIKSHQHIHKALKNEMKFIHSLSIIFL